MPRKRGGSYSRPPKPLPGDHLSIEERALLKALGIDAVRPELAKKIKAESPFAPSEDRAEKIKTLVEQNSDEALVELRVRIPASIYRTIEEVAKLQELTLTAATARLLLLGANKLGSLYDRKKIETLVAKLVTEILLPPLSLGGKQNEDDDPFSHVDPRLLGRGLATELIRAKRKEDGEDE